MRDEKVDNCDSFSLASDSTNNSHSTQYAISVRYIYNLFIYSSYCICGVFTALYIPHCKYVHKYLCCVCLCFSDLAGFVFTQM